MMRPVTPWCWFAAIVAAAMPHAVAAQIESDVRAASQNADDNENVIVVTGSRERFRPDSASSATKLPLSLQETPQAITVISSDLVKIAGIKSVADLSNYSAGVSRGGSADGIGANINIRGFDVDRRNGGYKLNGVIYPSDVPLDFAVVERIEILKGPSSIVAGAVDYAGTVNIVTKAPKFQSAFAFTGEGGSDRYARGILDATGPVVDDVVAARVVVAAQDVGSFVDHVYNRSIVVMPSFTARLGSSTTFDLAVYHQYSRYRPTDGFAAFADGTLPKPDTSNFFGALYNRYTQNSTVGSAMLTRVIVPGWTAKLIGGYGHQSQDGNSTYLFGDASAETGVRGDQYLYNFGETFLGSRDLTGEVRLTGELMLGSLKQQLVMSAEIRDNRSRTKDYFEQLAGIINVLSPDNRDLPFLNGNTIAPAAVTNDHSTRLGFTGFMIVRPFQGVTVLGGLRREGQRSRVITRSPDDTIITDDRFAYQWKTLPRLGVTIALAPNLNVYGSYSKGIIFQAGLLDRENNPVAAETGTQYEAGLKADLFERRMSMTAAVYQIDRSNVAVIDPTVPGFETFSLISGERHRGIEFEAVGEPVKGLNIIAAYAYSGVSIREAEDPARIGQRIPNVPKHAASLFTTYQLQSGWLKGASVGGGIAYVGARETDYVGTLSLPSYVKVDLRLAYLGLEDWTFALNAENVGNTRIYSSSYGDTQFGLRYESGRTVRLLVEKRF